ncbi:MAG: hypothetical protein ACI4N3_05085 [Alphaproteobacteria bacterium]
MNIKNLNDMEKECHQYKEKQIRKEIKTDEKILDKHINKIYEATDKVAKNFERVSCNFRYLLK